MHGSEKKTCNVHRQHGHQDGHRRGKAKAYSERYGRSKCSRMDHSFIFNVTPTRLENVEGKFIFRRCIRQGGVEVPTLWLKLAMHILWSGRREWTRKRMGVWKPSDKLYVGRYWIIMSHSKVHLEHMRRIIEAERLDPTSWDLRSSRQKHGGGMRRSTRAKMCRGGQNAEGWWNKSTACLVWE